MSDDTIPDKASYNNIKDHFLTKFAYLDEILSSSNTITTKAVLTEFI